tara:strand:+ start:157 stop:1080 length:924 start_codon:yes stop_codon:yes gene_type:complete
MDNIKSSFSIKNLENISGIKAHTIRIWEKRYNLLSPERTETNIRRYSLESLRKLLNITLLYDHGFKISKIAGYDEAHIPDLVRNVALKSNTEQISINALKLSMVNFDTGLFDLTFKELIKKKDFEFIYMNVFTVLMRELGILWQTDAISPSHEHFITNLIKQKIHTQTEIVQLNQSHNPNDPCFVLFLPENEIHELSILFLNQLILSKGYKTIFLGQSVPSESLKTILSTNPNLHFVTFCTVEPNQNKIDDFLLNFEKEILDLSNSRLSMFGPRVQSTNRNKLPSKITIFEKLDEFKVRYLSTKVFA